jgi:DNA-binding NarL/FixJ family response regulator
VSRPEAATTALSSYRFRSAVAPESAGPAAAPASDTGLRVAVAARGGLAGEAIVALLRHHGIDACAHDPWDPDAPGLVSGARPGGEPHAVLLLDELGALLEPTVAAVRAAHPGARVVLLAREADAAAVSGAVELGLHGLVDGQAHGRELVQALRDVVGGRRVFPAHVVLDGPAATAPLSRRQRDVLQLVAQGLSNGQIAAELQITTNTVKFHVRTIFRDLGIHNRVEAARLWAAGAGPARPFG